MQPRTVTLISGSDKARREQIWKMRADVQRRKRAMCVWKGNMSQKWRREMAVGGGEAQGNVEKDQNSVPARPSDIPEGRKQAKIFKFCCGLLDLSPFWQFLRHCGFYLYLSSDFLLSQRCFL